jgi:hypothetical protein
MGRRGKGMRKNLNKYVNVEDNSLCVTEFPLV